MKSFWKVNSNEMLNMMNFNITITVDKRRELYQYLGLLDKKTLSIRKVINNDASNFLICGKLRVSPERNAKIIVVTMYENMFKYNILHFVCYVF